MQGFLAEKTSDRFKAGKPDLRIGRKDLGQLDVELKYNDWPKQSLLDAREIDTGMTKLQWLKVRGRNEHGMRAICLVYFEAFDTFLITTDQVLRAPLHWDGPRAIKKLPSPTVIDGVELFQRAREHLANVGYSYGV